MSKKHFEIKNTEFISTHTWLKLSSVARITSHYHKQLIVKNQTPNISFILKLREATIFFVCVIKKRIP